MALHELPSPESLATLSRFEHERAARFVFERDRRRYLASHCALRQLLSTRIGTAAEQLVFDDGPFGKPALRNPPHCAFNLSHSEDVAVVAMADQGEIGVDVEMLRPMPDAIELARENFSAAECAELAVTPAEHQSLAFLLGWTRKEACLKAIGSGLSITPNMFTAGLTLEPRIVRIATPAGAVSVLVQSLRPNTDIVVSLARIETERH